MSNRKKAEISNVWPIRAVENDCLVSKWGDITVAFEVLLPEIYTMSVQFIQQGSHYFETGDFKDQIDSWVKALAVLPDNVIIHKQDWHTIETYQPNSLVQNYLDKASERHFNERPYLFHRCYLYITKTHNDRKDITATYATLARGRILPKSITDKKGLEQFFSAIEQFASIMNSSRTVKLQRLFDDDLFSLTPNPAPDAIDPVRLPYQHRVMERYLSLEQETDTIPLVDVVVGTDGLMVGDKHVRFYSLSDIDDMPDFVHTHTNVQSLSSETSKVAVGFASPVSLMLNCNHIYNQYIFKEDRQVVLPELEKRAIQMTGLGSFSKANESNARMIHEYLNSAADTGDAPVRGHNNIMCWSNDKNALIQIRNQTNAAISKMGIRPRETSGAEGMSLFWAGIPGNAGDLSKEEKFWSFATQVACLFNQETNTTTSLSNFGVKVTERLSGAPLLVDFSDVPMQKNWVSNRNKFILGPSGSGKSFLTNHFLRTYYNSGAHIVVVDVGDSYEGLSKMLGGKYLTYKADAPISFNPFYIENRMPPDLEKIEAIKGLILTLWKKDDESLTRVEETALGLSVSSYFDLLQLDENQNMFPSFNTYYDYICGDFKGVLDKEGYAQRLFDYDSFRLCMKPFYKGGEYDYLLNSTTNLDLTHERFVVFELDNIKDNKILMPVVTIIIMDIFITKMRTLKNIRKIILIEEAWKAIMKPAMAEFIKYLYKTVRKHFGEAWIVTQEVDDIIGSAIVKDSILNNADCRILMDQKKYANKFDHVKALLALTEKQKSMALSLNKSLDPWRKYKEFFVSWGEHSVVFGLEVSPEEYYAFTTEQSEKYAIQQRALKNGGNIDLAIREHIESLKEVEAVA